MIYKANILVVDDDLAVCRSVAAVFKDEACTVDTVNSGDEAVKKINEKNYALAIVDLMMPGKSGMDVIKELKNKKPDITIIMITGYPSIKTAVKAIKSGAYDYIPKPFTPAELRSMVTRALEKRHAYEEISCKLGIKEEKLVDISIPRNLYGIPGHSWASVEENGNVRVGMHHAMVGNLRNIETVEFPGQGEMRYQGEACVRFLDPQKHVLRIWTPVSGKVVAVNEELSTDISKLIRDPYGDGWLVEIQPAHLDEDLQNLEPLSSGPATRAEDTDIASGGPAGGQTFEKV